MFELDLGPNSMNPSDVSAIAAPPISHFTCWRISPVARRQRSDWTPIQLSAQTPTITRHTDWTTPNQAGGWLTTVRSPSGTRWMFASITALAMISHSLSMKVAAAATYAASIHRSGRVATRPSGKSRIAIGGRMISDGTHSGSRNSETGPPGQLRPCW